MGNGGLISDRIGFCSPHLCLDFLRTRLASTSATTMLMGSSVLFHVVFASKGLVTLWAEGVFFARVLLGVTRGMARGGEIISASILLSHGTRILIFLGSRF